MEEVDPEFGLTYDNFVKKFKQWMKENALSQRMVAPALCVSQGHLCDLLAQNKATSWTMITEEGRKPYGRMSLLMNDKATLEALRHNPKLFSGEEEPLPCHKRESNFKKSSRFTPYQKTTLEKAFQLSKYPTKPAYGEIAEAVGLSCAQVRTWFNNRRKIRAHGASVKESRKENKDDSAKVAIKVRNGKICPTSGWSSNRLQVQSSSNPQESVLVPRLEAQVNADVSNCQHSKSVTVAAGRVDKSFCTKECQPAELSDLLGVGDCLVADLPNPACTQIDFTTQRRSTSQEEASNQSGKLENSAADVVTSGLNCTDFLSVQDIVDLIQASSSMETLPATSESTDTAASTLQLNAVCNTEDDLNIVVGEQTWSSREESLTPEDDNLRHYTDTQLKFLRLAYDVHRFPSDDVVDALHVLTSVEKEDIQNWFFQETLRKTVS